MKEYKLTFTVTINSQDDPAAREKASAILEAVDDAVPFATVKLQEVFADKPPRVVRLNSR